MQYVHAIHTHHTYMQSIHAIHTCNIYIYIYMQYTHETQPKNEGLSVMGTPKIALKSIWRVLIYTVFHTEFEFPINFGGYLGQM